MPPVSLCSRPPHASLCLAQHPVSPPTSLDTSDRREPRDPSPGLPRSSSLGCSPEDAAPPCLLNKHMPRPQSVLLDCAPGLLGHWAEDRQRLGSHQHGSRSPSGPQQETAAPGPVASFGWTLPSPPPQASSRPHMTLTSRSDWPSRNTEGATPRFHVRPPATGTTAEAQPGPGSWRGAARAEVLSHSTSSGPLWVLEDGSWCSSCIVLWSGV